jgi:SprT protein
MANIPNLLSSTQQEYIEQKTTEWLDLARSLWNRDFTEIPVIFDLRGKTSGMYVVRGHWKNHKEQKIRYNPAIFARHFEESCATTIPHEVAHHICYELHGKKAKPHGMEWREIMHAFGVPAETTCKLDLSDIPQKQFKRFEYICNCGSHQLTSVRHNRIKRGQSRYACPKCHQLLVRA